MSDVEHSENPELQSRRPAQESARPSGDSVACGDAGSVAQDPAGESGGELAGESLRAEIEELKKQLHHQTLRAAADLDNYRKRARKDLEESQRRVREDLLRELLPVFDNLERAVAAAKDASDLDSVVQGIQMVLRLFEDVGQRFQLERVPAVGQVFDPTVHEAIQQFETSEHPEGTVVSEFVPGYKLAGRLVRPAGVSVARKPAVPTGSSPS
jgi:molecular chaperone GrpE